MFPLSSCSRRLEQSGRAGGRTDAVRPRSNRGSVALLVVIGAGFSGGAVADPVTETVTGAPQQIVPSYLETGVPTFTVAPGQVVAGPVDGGVAGGGGPGDEGTPSLQTMLSQSWGTAAVNDAQALGVSASAVAATCVLESGCQNDPTQPGGTVSGVFQMTNATYTADMAAAIAADPALASQMTQGLAGKMDPATEAIAAAQDLKSAALQLQAVGVADPTVLDVRGAYNFGSGYAAPLAQAPDGQLMSQVLSSYSPSELAANGISVTTTVGQWRQGIVAKIGSTAYVPVLAG